MRALQLLLKTSPAALLLILCLRLGTGAAQELPPNIISANLTIIPNGVPTNYLVTFSVTNHETPCVVIKTAIQATPNVVFPFGNFAYTSCLCSTRNFFWDIQTFENATIIGLAQVVSEENICPPDVALYPVTGDKVFVVDNVNVTP
nr:prolactin-inducible protein homolog [Camelus bactrianus]